MVDYEYKGFMLSYLISVLIIGIFYVINCF